MSIESTELKIFIDNDYQLYSGQRKSIIENLLKKKNSGKYDSAKSVKLWEYLAESGAKKYAKEFGGTWHSVFSVADRKQVARELRDDFEAAVRAGEYKELQRSLMTKGQLKAEMGGGKKKVAKKPRGEKPVPGFDFPWIRKIGQWMPSPKGEGPGSPFYGGGYWGILFRGKNPAGGGFQTRALAKRWLDTKGSALPSSPVKKRTTGAGAHEARKVYANYQKNIYEVETYHRGVGPNFVFLDMDTGAVTASHWGMSPPIGAVRAARAARAAVKAYEGKRPTKRKASKRRSTKKNATVRKAGSKWCLVVGGKQAACFSTKRDAQGLADALNEMTLAQAKVEAGL